MEMIELEAREKNAVLKGLRLLAAEMESGNIHEGKDGGDRTAAEPGSVDGLKIDEVRALHARLSGDPSNAAMRKDESNNDNLQSGPVGGATIERDGSNRTSAASTGATTSASNATGGVTSGRTNRTR